MVIKIKQQSNLRFCKGNVSEFPKDTFKNKVELRNEKNQERATEIYFYKSIIPNNAFSLKRRNWR